MFDVYLTPKEEPAKAAEEKIPEEKPTIEKIKAEILRLVPSLGNTRHQFLAAQFLLSATVVGTSYNNIAEFMGVSPSSVRIFWMRAKRNKIFVGRKVSAEWLCEDGLRYISFLADVKVVSGLMERSTGKRIK